MTLDLEKLTDQLKINGLELNNIKNRIVNNFDDENKLRALLKQQCLNQKEAHCLSCDDEGDCFILKGIIYLKLNKIKNSIKELEHANQHLRSKDETWNSIVGWILLGLALEKCGKEHLALHEYNKAHEKLKNNYLRVHAHDYTYDASELEKDLIEKTDKLSAHIASTPPTSKTEVIPQYENNKDYLALFSIPIYGTVEAGLNGELHFEHFDTFTIVNQVELQGQVFDLRSVYNAASMDQQITVANNRTHGWLRVHGLSMNDWIIPFDENDYALFYKASAASHLDYVIASSRDASGEIALMIKRFDERNNQLLSKSKDTSKLYKPIPLDKDHQIVGVVIAVAKPQDKK